MATAIFATKLVHIMATAAWFGHKLLVPADIRGSLRAGPEAALALLTRMERAAKVGIGSGMLTLVSGLTLVFMSGGFGGVPVRIHVGLVLTLLIFVVGAAFARPTWLRVEAAVRKGDLQAAGALAERMVTFFTLENLLWTATLVTMVFKI